MTYVGAKPTNVPLTSADIEDGVVSAADLGANSVDSSELVDGSVDLSHMSVNSIDSDQYVDGSIDTAHIADDQITLAKMASGTDGNIISYDASGNPVAIATGNDGQVLTSAGAGQPPAFEAAPTTTFAGIDDQSSSNDDQLTITDSTVVINEDGDNVDFRVESDTKSHCLFVDASGNSSAGFVSINTDSNFNVSNIVPSVGLTINAGNYGAATASASADELVITNAGSAGMSILTNNDQTGSIYFGDQNDFDVGQIVYNHSDNSLKIISNAAEAMRIDSSQKLLVGKTSSNTATVGLELVGADNYIFVTRDHPDGCFIGRNNNDSTPGKVFQGLNANGSESSWIKQNGTGYMPNGWSTSDSNGKNIIGEVTHGLDKLNQVTAKSFYWKTRFTYKDDDEEVINGTKKVGEVKFDDTNFDDNKHYGVIAQELQSVLPDIVHDKEPELRVDYNALLMVAINAIKELSTKNDSLTAKITTLETKVTALENA